MKRADAVNFVEAGYYDGYGNAVNHGNVVKVLHS